jgi:hypothetical protein
MSDATIPLRAVGPQPAPVPHNPPKPHDAPYRAFIAASLTLGVGGGFLLAVLLPLAGALEWDWGRRFSALVQAHGQLQLVGFAGLFTAGMSLRLIPRFSGRPLAFWTWTPWIIVMWAASLIIRALAQPAGDSVLRDGALILAATAFVLGAALFAAVIWRTLIHPQSRAEATAWFLCLGALAVLSASLLNFAITIEMVRDDLNTAPTLRHNALLALEQYGFVLMFLSGIGLRAVPNLVGRSRPERPALVAAVLLAAGVAMYAFAALYASFDTATAAIARVSGVGLILIGAAFVVVAWLSGVFRPNANRVAAASQVQFWFVRAAMAWLVIGGAMMAWFALRAMGEPRLVDAFAMDAVRHAIAIGVITNMIVGMAMLVVPEFAGRRLQHPNERWLVISMIVALNVAAVLRIWPALEGIEWLESTRWWPMAIAGLLTEAVILTFALMFAQSWREQRPKDWATPRALARRRATAP